MLGSRQPTQEELDEPPVAAAATHLRKRLLKSANVDWSSYDADEVSPR